MTNINEIAIYSNIYSYLDLEDLHKFGDILEFRYVSESSIFWIELIQNRYPLYSINRNDNIINRNDNIKWDWKSIYTGLYNYELFLNKFVKFMKFFNHLISEFGVHMVGKFESRAVWEFLIYSNSVYEPTYADYAIFSNPPIEYWSKKFIDLLQDNEYTINYLLFYNLITIDRKYLIKVIEYFNNREIIVKVLKELKLSKSEIKKILYRSVYNNNIIVTEEILRLCVKLTKNELKKLFQYKYIGLGMTELLLLYSDSDSDR